MFAWIKGRYSNYLLGVFAFIFISLTAYNSYASVCFLPTGNCVGESGALDTSDDLPAWCEDGENCDNPVADAEGSINNPVDDDMENSKKEEEDEQISECQSQGLYDTLSDCQNVYKSCKQIGSCWGENTTPASPCNANNGYYNDETECKRYISNSSSQSCVKSGECWIVKKCSGYNVAKSTIEALQTAYDVASFDEFVTNLSKYTLEECSVCPDDAAKYKCEYVGCPAGKTLYLNVDDAENGAKSMLSKTELTNADYKYFSIHPLDFSVASPKKIDGVSDYIFRDRMAAVKSQLCSVDCYSKQDGYNTVHGYMQYGENTGYCVASFIGEPIYDERGLAQIGSASLYNYGFACLRYFSGYPTQSWAERVRLCQKCMDSGGEGYNNYTKLEYSGDYYRNYFAFIPFDKNEKNIAVEMGGCTDTSFDNCQLASKLNDLQYKNIKSLCLNKNEVVSEYFDSPSRAVSRSHAGQVLKYLNNDEDSSFYGKYPDGANYVVFVEKDFGIKEVKSCDETEGTLVEYDDLYDFYERKFGGAPDEVNNWVDTGNEYVYDVRDKGETFIYYPKEETFDSFLDNLSRYTLEECNACTVNGDTKFKCKYVGCPDGKKLYVNYGVKSSVESNYSPITTLFSKTAFSDIKSDWQYYRKKYSGSWSENITMIEGGYMIPTSCEGCYKEAEELGIFDRNSYVVLSNGVPSRLNCNNRPAMDLGSEGNLGKVTEATQSTSSACSRWIYCKGKIQGGNYEDYIQINPIYGINLLETTDEELKNIAKERICVFENNPEEEWKSLITGGKYNMETRYVYDFTSDYMVADTTQILTSYSSYSDLGIANDDTADVAICAGPQVYTHTERITDRYGTGTEVVKEKPIVLLPPAKWLEDIQ